MGTDDAMARAGAQAAASAAEGALSATGEFIDIAYKMGAGRYIQQPGALARLAEEVRMLGSKCYVVGGPTALGVAEGAMVASLREGGVPYKLRAYAGSASYAGARELAGEAASHGCDVIVGVGGGRAMDLSKAVAATAGLPVIEVPTSIATCAAFTPLSVMYTLDGERDGTWRYQREMDGVIVDETVLATQPPRFVAAGVLDAMAKVYEVSHASAGPCEPDFDFTRYCAYRYAQVDNDLLWAYGLQAYRDVKEGSWSKALSHVAFLNIALTGVVSAAMRGYHQTALAHRLYDGIRTVYTAEAAEWLHGELVAVGLLLQTAYNDTPGETDRLRNLMQRMDMPTCLSEVGVSPQSAKFGQLREYTRTLEFVPEDATWQRRFDQAFDVVAH